MQLSNFPFLLPPRLCVPKSPSVVLLRQHNTWIWLFRRYYSRCKTDPRVLINNSDHQCKTDIISSILFLIWNFQGTRCIKMLRSFDRGLRLKLKFGESASMGLTLARSMISPVIRHPVSQMSSVFLENFGKSVCNVESVQQMALIKQKNWP